MELETNEEISKLRAQVAELRQSVQEAESSRSKKGRTLGKISTDLSPLARRSQCPQPIRRHDDSDRSSRFHIEASRERRSVTRSIQRKWVRVIDTRYGMRGVRVGEASHPGPRFFIEEILRTSRQGALTPIDTADRTDVDSEALLDELARDLSPVHDGSASPQPTAAAASG